MVLGILSLLYYALPPLSIILGILSLIFGILTIKKNERKRGFAIAGIICSCIGMVLAVVIFISCMTIVSRYDDFAYGLERFFESLE